MNDDQFIIPGFVDSHIVGILLSRNKYNRDVSMLLSTKRLLIIFFVINHANSTPHNTPTAGMDTTFPSLTGSTP